MFENAFDELSVLCIDAHTSDFDLHSDLSKQRNIPCQIIHKIGIHTKIAPDAEGAHDHVLNMKISDRLSLHACDDVESCAFVSTPKCDSVYLTVDGAVGYDAFCDDFGL